MTKTNKILRICGISLAMAGVLVLLSFVGSMRTSSSCEEVLIEINRDLDIPLLSEDNLRGFILQTSGPIVGSPLNQVETKSIESNIKEIPFVAEATVYKTIDKRLIVEVKQRIPIVRLIDRHGFSALLSREGVVMPTDREVSVRLPVITGEFDVAYDEYGQMSMVDSIHQELYSYAKVVSSDSFWQAQIQHTTYHPVSGFTAYPQVGKHQVLFGNAEKIETKFLKLRRFYQGGVSEANWNKYAKINLKYEDQIVCTKK